MKAGTRLGMVGAAAALALAALPARAQESPPPVQDQPADAIGPRELQNFSIDGTVTRRAEPPPATPARARQTAPATPRATTPAPTASRPAPATATTPRPVASAPAPATERPPAVTEREAVTPRAAPAPAPAPVTTIQPRTSPAPTVTVPLPPLDGRVSEGSAATYPQPNVDAPSRGFATWPWLLAALALALGGFYLWRSRSRHALADFDETTAATAFAAPEPAEPPRPPQPQPQPRALPPQLSPAPQPARAPPPGAPSAAPASLGIVSTRLRPRVEFAFTPLRCVVDDERVLIDFEVELFNSGSAPARAVLIEASMFNAGPAQDQAIDAFFANPVGQGERITAIAPMNRFSVRSQVAAPRANVQVFNVEGREMFVPLIAFNSLYRWSSGEAQSSSAFLVGRDTGGAKLAPLRTDLGPRQFAGLGARPLPNQVRS